MNLFQEIQKNNKVALAKSITLIESSLESDIKESNILIEKCLPISGNSIRIGITGMPGVGKSTFIETFGELLIKNGKRVAVLAIDPTSERTKGSILGDKSRMNKLAAHNNAFVRPSPNSGFLGGIGRRTRESIILCEAAGYNIILIETVGVGQNEISVKNVVDFMLLLTISGAGDELQAIKRGIIEEADLIIINKADKENITLAQKTHMQYKNSIELLAKKTNGWKIKTGICSALYNTGINKILDTINKYHVQMNKNSYLQKNRENQKKYWLHKIIKEELGNKKHKELERTGKLVNIENKLDSGKTIHQILQEITIQ